jgi:hypothetical protein
LGLEFMFTSEGKKHDFVMDLKDQCYKNWSFKHVVIMSYTHTHPLNYIKEWLMINCKENDGCLSFNTWLIIYRTISKCFFYRILLILIKIVAHVRRCDNRTPRAGLVWKGMGEKNKELFILYQWNQRNESRHLVL